MGKNRLAGIAGGLLLMAGNIYGPLCLLQGIALLPLMVLGLRTKNLKGAALGGFYMGAGLCNSPDDSAPNAACGNRRSAGLVYPDPDPALRGLCFLCAARCPPRLSGLRRLLGDSGLDHLHPRSRLGIGPEFRPKLDGLAVPDSIDFPDRHLRNPAGTRHPARAGGSRAG